MTWVEVERFEATDAAGRRYVVVGRQQQVPFNSLSGKKRHVGGSIDYALTDGRSVSPVPGQDPEEFEIIDTDERIQKVP